MEQSYNRVVVPILCRFHDILSIGYLVVVSDKVLRILTQLKGNNS